MGVILYVGAGVTLKLLLSDPTPWWITTTHLGGVATAGLLLSRRFFRTTSSGLARETALLACCLIVALAAILMLVFGDPTRVTEDFTMAILPVNFILIFVPLRFPAAVAFLTVAFGVFVATILTRDHLAAQKALFSICMMASFCLPALVGVHMRERATRRLYLHGLLEKLRSERLAEKNASLEDLTLTDSLTGVANRRGLDTELKAFCAVPGGGGAFLLIDVDRFKDFNDRFGHLAGDDCLRQVAGRLSAHLRQWEFLARFGGEEFAVVLPGAGAGEAALIAERLREAVQSPPICVGEEPVEVTVSIGLSLRGRDARPDDLIGAADQALYAAKNAGRNQVRAAAGAAVEQAPSFTKGVARSPSGHVGPETTVALRAKVQVKAGGC